MDTSFDGIDVEEYRRAHESEREWRLRRAFILSNKDQLKKDELITLASCYVNVHFYGCSYPPDLMQRLSYYENNVEKNLLTESRPKLVAKRTLGGETWRAPPPRNKVNMCSVNQAPSLPSELEQLERKFCNLSSILNELLVSRQPENAVSILQMAIDKNKMVSNLKYKDFTNGKFTCILQVDYVNLTEGEATTKKQAKFEAFQNAISLLKRPNLKIMKSNNDPVEFYLSAPLNSNIQIESSHSRSEGNYDPPANFVLLTQQDIQHNATSLLRRSAEFNKSQLEFDVEYIMKDDSYECRLSLEGKLMAIDKKSTREEAMSGAAEKALEILRKTCYTIISKSAGDVDINDAIQKDQLLLEETSVSSTEVPIPDSNIGNQLLRRMGWSGGGVGREGNLGIVNPIGLNSVRNREGLGLQRENGISPVFENAITKIIENFIRNNRQDDLIFAPSFSVNERKIIHNVAQKMRLKTKSYNKAEERYLVLSRKRSPQELLTYLLNNNGETRRYSLIPPDR